MTTREASRADGLGVVEQLAAWVLATRAHDLSQAAVRQAKLLLLDTIGCGFPALSEQSARALLEVVETSGGAPQCTVIGQARRTSAPNATLANGALVRILDFNDYVNARGGDLGGHPSDNIPVALAAGELSGASGARSHRRGRARLRDFRPLQGADGARFGLGRRHGLRSGGARDGGPPDGARPRTSCTRHRAQRGARRHLDRSALRGHFRRQVHFQRARGPKRRASGAIGAERGITGPLDLFENPRGMREVFCKGDAAAALTAPLPAESYIMAANVKAFPCLATGQSVVAAGIEMHGRLRGAVDRLTGLRLIIPDTPGLRRQKDDPGRIKPASREAADHSFNFLAAVSLIDGEFGLAQFDGDRWNDPKVCALMARLEIINDSSWNRRAPDSYPCSFAVRTEDGREEVVEVPYPPGFSRGRLEAETVMKKFNTLTAPHLARGARDRIIEAVMALDESASCAELMAAVATESAIGPGRSRSASPS
jgi:2-methylcitrate dehydratase